MFLWQNFSKKSSSQKKTQLFTINLINIDMVCTLVPTTLVQQGSYALEQRPGTKVSGTSS